MNEKLFSVVMPAYNAEHFIRDALDSVAKQTICDYDIVVVDDGSTDQTVGQVKAWAAAHQGIKLRILQQQHGGIGMARNRGIREAVGTYVAFLDSDDIWVERKLEAVVTCLGDPKQVDLVCHDEWLEEGGSRTGRLTHGPYTTYQDLLFKGNSLSTSATVVRRKRLMEVGGFSEDLRFNSMEDYDLWLRLARAGCRIEYLHEVLGTYRQHGQGVTSRIEMHCRNGLNVLETHFQEWPRRTPYFLYLMHCRRASMIRGAGRAFMKLGMRAEANRFFHNAIYEDPFSLRTWALSVLNWVQVNV